MTAVDIPPVEPRRSPWLLVALLVALPVGAVVVGLSLLAPVPCTCVEGR